MEPRFSLPASTPRSSKTELVIGGVKIYIYGLSELDNKEGVEIGVLYLAHMRTRTYLATEAIAHEVLHQYRRDVYGKKEEEKKKMELIAVTMDMRNHGEREISPQANLTWKDGNETHAMDLLSTITGSTQDFKLILDYLPTYLPQFTTFHNIILGISLGGHLCYRLSSHVTVPSQVKGYVIIIGCPDLSSLLLTRLGVNININPSKSQISKTEEESNQPPNSNLEALMAPSQTQRWPPALSTLISSEDQKIFKEFPADIPVLICGGRQDTLVPISHTEEWLEKRKRDILRPGQERNVELFVQGNTGHSCTKEMVDKVAGWIGDVFEAESLTATHVVEEGH